jgi:hypothetical protein
MPDLPAPVTATDEYLAAVVARLDRLVELQTPPKQPGEPPAGKTVVQEPRRDQPRRRK